jgi:hypothetical protein
VFQLTPKDINPAALPLPRVSRGLHSFRSLCFDADLIGPTAPIIHGCDLKVLDELRGKFVDRHPGARPYIQEFDFYLMTPAELYYYEEGYQHLTFSI